MRRRAMILGLECQELVDSGERGGIVGANPDFPSPGKGIGPIPDERAPGGHHHGAGDLLGMHEPWETEIPPGEPVRNVRHVGADGGGPGGIDAVALQHDPPPIGQGLEHMRGGVLIHAHGDRTPFLHRGECAVGPRPGVRGPRAAQDQAAEDQNSCHGSKAIA